MFEFFSTKGFKTYLKQAQKILDGNWTGHYTRPSPHQWNWDSGFIAIGYAHYNQDRAMREIRSLFDHQWPNGMIPQIVFNPDALGNYFPEPDFWQVPGGALRFTPSPVSTFTSMPGKRAKPWIFSRRCFPN
ncbi:MAG: hypothetical protein JRF41_13280 [Deltaproteobacteria bacterium]|nr:hypothetical protein [Deltaproteobacteria bacterium]